LYLGKNQTATRQPMGAISGFENMRLKVSVKNQYFKVSYLKRLENQKKSSRFLSL
jgi:hypothetical protein